MEYSKEEAQEVVDKLWKDFAREWEEVPRPEVVENVEGVISSLRKIGITFSDDSVIKGMFSFLEAGYLSLADRSYFKLDIINARQDPNELRYTVYHELLHRVLHLKFLNAGYCFALVNHGRVKPEWVGWRSRLAMAVWMLQDHFLDFLVDKTLIDKQGLKSPVEKFDSKILERWKLGPIYYPLELGISNPDVGVACWLTEGIEYCVHELFGDGICAKTVREMAPQLAQQSEEVLQGLTMETSVKILLEHLKNLYEIAALDVEFNPMPTSNFYKYISKIPEIYALDKYFVPYVKGVTSQALQVLKLYQPKDVK